MKVLTASFAVACVLALVVFGVILLIFPQALDEAKAVGGFIIATFPTIHQFLEQQNGRRNLAAGRRSAVYDFRGFQIPWQLMVLYGAIIVAVVFVLGHGIVGFIVGFHNGYFKEVYKEDPPKIRLDDFLPQVFTYLVWIVGSYLVGRWVGTRCARKGLVAMLLMGPLGWAIFMGSNAILMGPSTWWTSLMTPSWESAVRFLLGAFAEKMCIFWGAGLFGYWRGHRQRLSRYLHYLLRVLPSDTRDTVVDLAFEEAQKLGGALTQKSTKLFDNA
jgi:hypothetical protein